MVFRKDLRDSNWETFTNSIIDSTLEEQCCLNWSPYKDLETLSHSGTETEAVRAFIQERLMKQECGRTLFALIKYSEYILDPKETSKLQNWRSFPNATTRQLLRVQYKTIEKFMEAFARQCNMVSVINLANDENLFSLWHKQAKQNDEHGYVSNFFACHWFTYPMKFGPPEPPDFYLFFLMCLTLFRASALDYHQRHVHQRCSCARQLLSKMFFYKAEYDYNLDLSQTDIALVYNWIRVYAIGGPATPEMMAYEKVAVLEKLSLLYGMNMKHLHECNYCAKLEESRKQFKVCKKCHNDKLMVRAFYCSLECHKKDWPLHKRFHSLMSA